LLSADLDRRCPFLISHHFAKVTPELRFDQILSASTSTGSSLADLEFYNGNRDFSAAPDAPQNLVFPLFAEGAFSPADDILDLAVAVILVRLLGWRWEFLPAFAAELVPGIDLVPFWTMAVGNVYRKWKQMVVSEQQSRNEPPVIEAEYKPSDRMAGIR
jgi:hypothetical protein